MGLAQSRRRLIPRRLFCVQSVLAFERYLIDKRLGDRLPEKQGSKQREVIEDGALLRGASLARLGDGKEGERRIRGGGAFLVMAISLSGVRFPGRGNGVLVEAG